MHIYRLYIQWAIHFEPPQGEGHHPGGRKEYEFSIMSFLTRVLSHLWTFEDDDCTVHSVNDRRTPVFIWFLNGKGFENG